MSPGQWWRQRYGFPSSHVWIWELDHKGGWALNNWCFWTVVLEKTFESPLDYKINLVNPKGNQSWIFIGWTDAEAETPIPWSPDTKSQLMGKDPGVGKDWRQKEMGSAEDEMFREHHWLNGHESERTRRWCRAEEPGVHVQGVAKSWTGFRKWTTINKTSQADLSLSHTLARGLA